MSLTCKHGYSVAIIVSIAFMVNYIHSFSNEYWLVLAAFFVSETTRGTPFKQGMLILLTMLTAMTIAFVLHFYILQPPIIYGVLTVLFMGGSYAMFLNRPQPKSVCLIGLVFAVTLLTAIYANLFSLEYLQASVFDVMVGALIAIMCKSLFFPARWNVEFSQGILPILDNVKNYLDAIQNELSGSVSNIVASRLAVENALLNMYPSWIYETGFNRGLRSGFRFFLVTTERAIEIFFSMDDLLTRGLDVSLLQSVRDDIATAMQKDKELLTILIDYFRQGKVNDTASDFTTDIAELEKAVHAIVPNSLETLALSPDYLGMTAFLRDMKDLRGLLLQLVMALPVESNQ